MCSGVSLSSPESGIRFTAPEPVLEKSGCRIMAPLVIDDCTVMLCEVLTVPC